MLTVTVQASDPAEPPAQAQGECVVCLVASRMDPGVSYAEVACLIHAESPQMWQALPEMIAHAVRYAENRLHLLGVREMCIEALTSDPRRIEYRH